MKVTQHHRSIILLAHNIRSLWNVGSFFRTADAFGIERIILTGYTATPPRREISKTAIGAQDWIPWSFERDPIIAMIALKEMGYTIVGLELTERSQNLTDYVPDNKLCLVVGHEVTGVPKELLSICDSVVAIPMCGKKESLNVAVAAGIALHHLRSS